MLKQLKLVYTTRLPEDTDYWQAKSAGNAIHLAAYRFADDINSVEGEEPYDASEDYVVIHDDELMLSGIFKICSL